MGYCAYTGASPSGGEPVMMRGGEPVMDGPAMSDQVCSIARRLCNSVVQPAAGAVRPAVSGSNSGSSLQHRRHPC
jgi:hypothetical protein